MARVLMDVFTGMQKTEYDKYMERLAKHVKKLSRPITKIRDGVLYINGNSVRRVACRLPRVPFNESEYYWEGRCIR